MDTDNQLLKSYACDGSECAFRNLVERHINLVHSAALREAKGDNALAEDITQAVFVELAQRATALVQHPALAGWLYTCVRRMTANVRRAEDRRRRREQEAFTMNELLGPDPADNLWHQVRPVLDDVMHELNEEDRTAVVLRFFEGRNLKEVGRALGLTENTARMRVERSLEKLRGLLSQRGIKSTASTLAAVLAAGAAMTAPAALASTVATGALATAASTSPAAFVMAKLLSAAKGKAAAAGALLVLASAVIVWQHVRSNRLDTEQTALEPSAVPNVSPPTATDAGPQDDFAIRDPAPTNAATASLMILQVVEAESGEPLPNTKLILYYFGQANRKKVVKLVTDANGRMGVDLNAPFSGLNLFVTADGHVPKVMTWRPDSTLPTEYTMKLERGITIGGTVVDEARQPIAGAKIEFDGPGNNMANQENIQFGPDATAITDADGRWSCNMIPKEYEQVSLLIKHPEHAETTAMIRPDAPDAGHSLITMKAGCTVAGVVQDLSGNPIESAKVREVRLNSEGERSQKTDVSGAFEFKSMKAGELMLAVQAKGFAPMVQTLQVADNVAAIRFQLGPGQLLRARVIDEAGNPITNANARTQVDWTAIRKVEWSGKTDADGWVEWDSAPQEPLLYAFEAEGFNGVYDAKLVADGSDHEIKLARHQPDKDTIAITGTAVDADTGLPLDTFNVMVGELDPDHTYPVRFFTAGREGGFSLSLPAKSSHPGYRIQIEKEGYLPAVTTNLLKKAGGQTFAFRLQRGFGPAGVVVLPSGEPAANAAVFLCTPEAGVDIDGPTHVARGINTTRYTVHTDKAGAFSLPPAPAPQAIIAIHEQGYAEIALADFEATARIILQPWGRVEGSFVLGSQPAANETIVAANQLCRYDEGGHRFPLRTLALETKTDSAGKFSLEKVMPGACNVFWRKESPREPGAGFDSLKTSIVVNAGETTEVTLGGSGRLIIGKALLSGAVGAIGWQGVPVRLKSKLASDPGLRPKRDDFSSNEAFIEVMDRWMETVHWQRNFWAFCDSDGSFRLQDIPPGTYELEIELEDSSSVSSRRFPDRAPVIASIVQEVIVPETPGGQSDEPLDLGALNLALRQGGGSAQQQENRVVPSH